MNAIDRLVNAALAASELMDGCPDDDTMEAASTELSAAAREVADERNAASASPKLPPDLGECMRGNALREPEFATAVALANALAGEYREAIDDDDAIDGGDAVDALTFYIRAARALQGPQA